MQYCKTTRVNHSDVRIRRPPTPGRKTIINLTRTIILVFLTINLVPLSMVVFETGGSNHTSLVWHSSKKSRCDRLSYMQLNRLRRHAKTLSVPASSSSSPSLVIISFFLANTNIEKFREVQHIYFFSWGNHDASRRVTVRGKVRARHMRFFPSLTPSFSACSPTPHLHQHCCCRYFPLPLRRISPRLYRVL